MDVISGQLTDALGIMGLGMSLVFAFLSILIFAIKLIAWKYAPMTQSITDTAVQQPVVNKPAVSPLMAAVIASAIYQHRRKV
ncbi:OadG family protein [Shewanella youngdeokensis]|uniref:Probable oxaloacetate decarboxylase gamma chain n=1 Tax=Shewanella youngdeokensis TaxID=2999068 RepID=A0ABZ0K135_9GAMM|nr:OadG family transporter subunit [Shewanella sp. DAU334]